MLEPRGMLNQSHRSKSGTVSCIPLHVNLHLSTLGIFPRKLKRWGSTGSWVMLHTLINIYRALYIGFNSKVAVNLLSLFSHVQKKNDRPQIN